MERTGTAPMMGMPTGSSSLLCAPPVISLRKRDRDAEEAPQRSEHRKSTMNERAREHFAALLRIKTLNPFFLPVYGYSAQRQNTRGAEEHVEGDPSLAQYHAETPISIVYLQKYKRYTITDFNDYEKQKRYFGECSTNETTQ